MRRFVFELAAFVLLVAALAGLTVLVSALNS